MRLVRGNLWWLSALALVACGGTESSTALPFSVEQALTQSAEVLEFEPTSVRQELFRELMRTAEAQEGLLATEPVLFPVEREGQFVGAPAQELPLEWLQVPDAGQPAQVVFAHRPGEGWSEDRRESLQGLSEREAAELVARSLLASWSVHPEGPVQVDRAAGAPYAAAYVEGMLRINPAFVYMAASVNPASSTRDVQ